MICTLNTYSTGLIGGGRSFPGEYAREFPAGFTAVESVSGSMVLEFSCTVIIEPLVSSEAAISFASRIQQGKFLKASQPRLYPAL